MEQNQTESLDLQRYLNFLLGSEQFAIPLLAVKEVIAIPSITPLPETPSYFLGLMNLRGQVIPIVDLRIKLQIKKSESSLSENAVIILDLESVCIGLVVDSVSSVLSIEKSQISDCPEIETKLNARYLDGIARLDEKLVLLINVFHVLNIEDKKLIDHHIKSQKSA
jgi:purine-binding chemotaxis protein CheW